MQVYIKKNHIKTNSKIIEIGSNDGTFLKNFLKSDNEILGFEPSQNVALKAKENGIPTINQFFNLDNVQNLKKIFRKNRCNMCIKCDLSYSRS